VQILWKTRFTSAPVRAIWRRSVPLGAARDRMIPLPPGMPRMPRLVGALDESPAVCVNFLSSGIAPNLKRRGATMTNPPLDVLNIDIGWLHIGAIGPLAIIVLAIIVGAYFVGRGLRHR
jgi:hypothetical protein